MAIATVYGHTDDFWMASESYTSASNAGSGVNLNPQSNTENRVVVGQSSDGSTYWTFYQAYIGFDTSAVPAGTDSAIQLVLNCYSNVSALNVRAREHAWTPGTAAWAPGSTITSKTLLGTTTVTGPAVYTINSATSVVPRSSQYKQVLYIDNIEYSYIDSARIAYFNSGDETGTTSDPKLTWTHVAPAHEATGDLVGQGSTVAGTAWRSKQRVPVSDVSAGTWSSTAATLYEAVDEQTADDADFIHTSTLGTAVIAVEAGGDPGTDEGFFVHYRASSDNGTRSLRVALKQGATLIAQETRTNVPTTTTAYTLALTSGQMATVTDFSALRIELEYL